METNFQGTKTGKTASGYWAGHPLLAIMGYRTKRPTTLLRLCSKVDSLSYF